MDTQGEDLVERTMTPTRTPEQTGIGISKREAHQLQTHPPLGKSSRKKTVKGDPKEGPSEEEEDAEKEAEDAEPNSPKEAKSFPRIKGRKRRSNLLQDSSERKTRRTAICRWPT